MVVHMRAGLLPRVSRTRSYRAGKFSVQCSEFKEDAWDQSPPFAWSSPCSTPERFSEGVEHGVDLADLIAERFVLSLAHVVSLCRHVEPRVELKSEPRARSTNEAKSRGRPRPAPSAMFAGTDIAERQSWSRKYRRRSSAGRSAISTAAKANARALCHTSRSRYGSCLTTATTLRVITRRRPVVLSELRTLDFERATASERPPASPPLTFRSP